MPGGDGREGSIKVRSASINLRAGAAAMLLSIALAGCSTKKDDVVVDPNLYPATYRTQLLEFLRQSLTSRPDFRGALIAPPILKQVGDNPRYIVCVQFTGNGQSKSKVAIFFAGMISQFVDASPEQCGDAAYQPFKELAGALPPA